MTEKMKMMLNEIIEKDLNIREIIEIIEPLSSVLKDRTLRDFYTQKRFLEDDAEQREKYDERIRWAEDDEKDSINDAEAVLRRYELDYYVDQLLGI